MLTRTILIKASLSVAALLFYLAGYTASAQADTQPRSANLRFTLPDKLGFPQDDNKEGFDCLDKIYAVTQLSGFKKGKHIVEFRWVDPVGETRERTIYDFYVREKPTTKLWAWLELSRGQGAGVIQWLNPAAGLEEFIGQWELKLLIDDHEYSSGEFNVNC